ncbi:MAG: ArsR/SmtB family transcription factor [Nocardioides sp.]|uniref:ArsR/SmtB family transcription factor n=1 Tax=Nocardioides sp. TaxID=35761 RepID=UPI003D6A2B80
MPRVIQSDPPPPMSVEIAARVFGSSLRLALLRHYRGTASSQADAAVALDLTQSVVSKNTAVLVDAGVVVADPPGRWKGTPGKYIVDEERLRHLMAVTMIYSLNGNQIKGFDKDLRQAAEALSKEGW